MIKLRDLCKDFGSKKVLKHIDLDIKAGETLAIIGGSGSGKSTLLKIMIGLLKPTSGSLSIMGQEMAGAEEDDWNRLRLDMGMVFQYSALFDSMTVGDNVAFGLREHTDYPEERIQQIVAEKLTQVGMPEVAGYMPDQLSGGMKKRVSLARAIAFEPKLIFYDEPSSGLDPVMTQKIDELILNIQGRMDVTSVVVTHDMASACQVADRIAMLYEGEIIAIEDVDRFRRLKDPRVRAFLRELYIDEGEETGK